MGARGLDQALARLSLSGHRPLADSLLKSVDETPGNSDITLMADETENPTLRLLREIRAEQEATNAKLDGFIAEQRAANAKLESKLDKLNIELIGVKGRVRKVEEAVEAIARVMSDGTFG